MELKIDNHITTSDFDRVKKWLEVEHKMLGGGSTGMIHNFKIIKRQAKEGKAILYRKDNVAIGIQTYAINGKKVFLDIIDIDPEFRKQGKGKQFVYDYIKYFVSKGIVVAELDPVTDDGLSLCKSTGFQRETSDYYYKILVEKRRQNKLAKRRLVIWAKEDFDKNEDPTYSWSLNFNKDKKPIIQYVDKDWRIGIIDGDKINADKVKYFREDVPEFYKDSYPFIYVNKSIAEKLIKF